MGKLSSGIQDLKVTCLPTPATPLIVDKTSTKFDGIVWSSDLLWETVPFSTPSKGQVGVAGEKTTKYLLQVFARDSQG